MTKIVLVTGGFDPLHSGHINCLRAAKQLGDELIVGVNSEDWLVRKKGMYFLPTTERMQIVRSLRWVDRVITFDDSNDSANDAILWCLRYIEEIVPDIYGHQDSLLIFANGGDRTEDNIPEMISYELDNRVRFEFNVGGAKVNSSSHILSRWSNNERSHKNDW